jgi:CRISPR-associated endonuclease/helicase Cas3
MHNLARSVIIFDEIQTLPLRCMHLFCNALNFLLEVCASSAVLCTATQPCLDELPNPYRGRLILPKEREIMPDIAKTFADLRRVNFFDHCQRPMTVEEIAALALEELERTHSCLIVCNTKAWADKVFAECGRHWSGARHYLSTNLCPAHRLEKLEALRRDLDQEMVKPVLCVSTQLIECGVDISFGSVIRFAAGLDSILQAAGRCNRHGGPLLGRVHIVTVENEKLEYLPDIKIGREVYWRIFREYEEFLNQSRQNLNQPEVITAYFQYYLHARKDIMAYKAPKHVRDDTLLNMLGKNVYIAENMEHRGMLRQSFMSASELFQPIDSPTQAVLVPYKDGKTMIAELSSPALYSGKRELLRAAQRYSVNLFPNIRQKLGNALHDIQQSGILCLHEAYYSEVFGVMTEPRGTMSTLNL